MYKIIETKYLEMAVNVEMRKNTFITYLLSWIS